MRGVLLAVLLTALPACSTLRNTDAGLGETVTKTRSDPTRILPDARHHFQRVRLIAPPGATECGLATLQGSPQRRNVPNARNEVEILVNEGERSTRFYCHTPGGTVRRDIDAVEISRQASESRDYVVRAFPPLVHVSAPDGEANARWASLQREICGEQRPLSMETMCRNESFARLRAADLGS